MDCFINQNFSTITGFCTVSIVHLLEKVILVIQVLSTILQVFTILQSTISELYYISNVGYFTNFQCPLDHCALVFMQWIVKLMLCQYIISYFVVQLANCDTVEASTGLIAKSDRHQEYYPAPLSTVYPTFYSLWTFI